MIFHLSTIVLVHILSGSLFGNPIRAEPLEGTNVTRVKEGTYQFVVSLAEKNDQLPAEATHFCSGVLVKKKFVLTAAHCFDHRTLDQIQIIVGSVDLRKGKKYGASTWITYNDWADSKNITKKKASNDIAMIKLSKRVRKRIAQPASFSTKTNHDLLDDHVILTGWGKTLENPNDPSRYLHEVEVKVVSNALCEKMTYELIKTNIFINERYLCTKGDPHAFVADGDSGGPVLRKNYVVGINKGSCLKDGLCNATKEVFDIHQYNVHTSIDFYRDFIVDVMQSY